MNLLSPLSIRHRAFSLMACLLKGHRRRSAQQYALAQAAEVMESRVVLTTYDALPADFPNQNVSGVFPHVTLATAAGFSGSSPVYTAPSSRQGPIQIFSPNSSAGGQTAGAFGSSNRLRLTFDRGVSDFEIVGYSGPAGSMIVGYFRSDMSLIEKHTISIERLVPGFDSFHRDAADIRYVFAEAININSFSYTLDDTPLPSSLSISATSANRNEGNSGSTPFTFTVTRSGDTSGPTSVSYEVAGGGTNPANAFDFTGATLPSGTVNFAANQTSKTITVNVNGDGLTESNEDFTVTLSNPAGGVTIATETATGTIINDDSSPAATISISVSPASVAENGTANLVYTFRRTGSTASDLSVFFTIDGSAFAPDDYTTRGEQLFESTVGIVRIPAGASSATLTVDPTPDAILEPDETVVLALAESSDYVIGSSSSATGTILADPPIADLRAGFIGLPESAAANTTISIVAGVDNVGTKASGSFDVKFYLSADDEITASDLLLTTVTRNSIAAGDDQNWTQLINLPKSVTEGDYWIGTIVDPTNKVAEADETNNTNAAGPFPVSGPPRPELAVSDFQIPYAFGAANGTISVNAVVDNLGLVSSGNFDVKFYLNVAYVTEGDIIPPDTLITTVTRNSIASKGNQSWTQSLTLPKNLAAGDYVIGMILDPANKILETDESNNLGYSYVTVVPGTPRPDLVANNLLTPDSGAANTNLSVGAEVANLGTKESGQFDVKFYLSADGQITVSDLLLTTVTRNTLIPGGLQNWTQLLSLPKTVNEGDYYIGMILDPALKIAESDETNNTFAAGPIPISGPPRPELAVNDFQIPYAFGAATGTVNVNAVVGNPALVASGSFDVKFYLSTDGDITASDTLLTTVTRNSIAAAGSQSWTQSLTLPKTLMAGDYSIGMILNPANKVIETDETNNIGSASVTIVPGAPRPDLVANNLVVPDSGAANTNLSVDAEVANLGTKESGKFDVKFYLSTDDQITASDLLLTTVTRNTLLPGGLQTWTQLLSLPKTVTEGDYYVGMILDPALKIAEPDETNNIFVAGSIPISGPPRPDLVVSDFQIPYAFGAATGTVSVNAVVDNPGLVASGSFDVKYYLSTDGDITTSDTLLTTVTRNSIAAQGHQSWAQSLTIPKNLAAGDYVIGMILDPANKIVETDESNNVGSASLTVVAGAPRPDMVVNNFVIPDSGAANTTISVNAEVANQGTKESGKFDIKFYLSFDDQITVGDMLLTTVTRNTILPGGIQNWMQSLSLPKAVTEGDYYIGMIIDPAFKVAESDENNNAFGLGPIPISGPPRPDLSGSLTIPASATAGNTISARIEVDNLSPTASGKFAGLFYLSDDDVITPDDLFVVAVFDRTSVAANGRQTWTQSLTLPKSLADGNYWLGFVIDAGEKIGESDESNNIVVGGPITVSAIPLPVQIATDDRLGNDRFDFAVGYPIVVTQPFQFSIRGHVGPGTQFGDDDGLDRFSFSFQRASTIRIELTNLSVNAGMLLDSLTPGVADKSSNNSGLTSEIITQSFPAGGTADLLINASTLGALLPFGATTYTLTVTIT